MKAAFFEQVFESCPCLGWAVSKQILKCFLTKSTDCADIANEEGGSRSNHQRLQAMEMFAFLIKASKSAEAKQMIEKNLALTTSVIIRVVQKSDSWQKKKTAKTTQCVNIFTKAAKAIGSGPLIAEQGAKLLKELEKVCAEDKSMANLKGKVKEIKTLIAAV